MVAIIHLMIWIAAMFSALLLRLIARNNTNRYQSEIFVLGILFNLGDILTTWLNLHANESAREVNKATVFFMENLGREIGLVSKFLLMLLAFYSMWRIAGLIDSMDVAGWIAWFWFFLGFYPTIWNLHLILFSL